MRLLEKHTMRQIFPLVIIMLGLSFNSMANADTDPSAQLEQVALRLIADIEKNKAQLQTDEKLAEQLVRQHLLPIIDVEGFSKKTLGKKVWLSMNEIQHKAFMKGYINQVIAKYAKGLAFYDGQAFVFEKAQVSKSGNAAQVESSMKQKDSQPLSIVYRLTKSDDLWLIDNIYVEGTNMRDSYKNQYLPRINEIGIEAFISELNKPIKK
jgi:phospholipid transport system substrate-binding protein